MQTLTQPLILVIEQATPLLNVWQRMHWSERMRVCRDWHLLTLAAFRKTGSLQTSPIEHCNIHIIRANSGRLPDWDGLYGGLKPLLDCLVVKTETNPHGTGIIVDDNPSCVLRLTAEPVKVKAKQGYTKVHITPIQETTKP